jgi:hypothetical protein
VPLPATRVFWNRRIDQAPSPSRVATKVGRHSISWRAPRAVDAVRRCEVAHASIHPASIPASVTGRHAHTSTPTSICRGIGLSRPWL